MTVAEVAELVRVNPQTVRNWIDKGSLPAARVGRRVRIRRSDLDRILDTGADDVEPGRASNQSDADIEPAAETTNASDARDRFAAALAETFRVAAGPDSSTSCALRALAGAAEDLATALDPGSRAESAPVRDGPNGSPVAPAAVTYRLTAQDIQGGRIRIPTASKDLFPPTGAEMDIQVRGTLLTARWDPRPGPGGNGAGMLRVGRPHLQRLVDLNDVLAVTVEPGGLVILA